MYGDWGKIIQVDEELYRKRSIPAQIFIDDINGFLIGPLTQHHPRRIARKNIEEKKHNANHSCQNEQTICYPPDEKSNQTTAVNNFPSLQKK